MNQNNLITMNEKVIDFSELDSFRIGLKKNNKSIVFTNGCFDIIHAGHVRYLSSATTLGDILIVALNTDDSIRKLKGPNRPINNLSNRIEVLAAIEHVDFIITFSEDTPYEVIKKLRPDIIVKGGDYNDPKTIVGFDLLEQYGGKVAILDYVKGSSTSLLIQKIIEQTEG